MATFGNHIINRVLVDVNLQNEKTAHQIKDDISGFLQNEVFPELESLLDELNAGNQIVRYNQLVFDLKIENWEQRHRVKKELVQKLRQNIVESLGIKVPAKGERWRLDGTGKIAHAGLHGEFVSPEQKNRKTLLFFLEHGYLPWYGKRPNLEELLEEKAWEKLVSDNSFSVQLISLFMNMDSALKRFVFQFSHSQVLSVIDGVNPVFTNRTGFEKFLQTLSTASQRLLIEYLLRISVSSGKEISGSRFLQLLRTFWKEGIISVSENSDDINKEFHKKIGKYLKDNVVHRHFQIGKEELKETVMFEGHHPFEHTKRGSTQGKGSIVENDPTVISKGSVHTENEKEPLFFENDAGEITVRNAGQVLFHPFLLYFFEHFEWLNEENKIKEEYRMLALQAVHFCATGAETLWEEEMILEKFLCGVSLETPVPAYSLLTPEIKSEANEMLQQVVDNWKALKNTSVEGMREMFFQRDGKLVRTDQHFKLIVERKAQDILLDKLPWGVSIIKLPWREQLLFVEW
ncbi:hypothetical protein D1614_17380 [Maribellus luteus]|uniref:Uncharacterized protein n=1 Tax=Maribellus luteus TaxID=2305463 RepID=A0A399SVE8_9BACT|nr:contractile injection system tape measure protein [Maribellus luteus]RIJ46704.1 hypothetical protein D1614_17380 [Maribellus luteus]